MVIKIFLMLIISLFSAAASSNTLAIHAKIFGEGQQRYMVYQYVSDYGWNSDGTFVIRFEDGTELMLGKRSHWEYFNYFLVHDNDQLHKGHPPVPASSL